LGSEIGAGHRALSPITKEKVRLRMVAGRAVCCTWVVAPVFRGKCGMSHIVILNGPNLNLLGEREPHIYGSTTLPTIEASCRELAQYLGVSLEFHQSNHEGVIVDQIQSARHKADAIIINPAGYSFTSVAILDALKAFAGPILEVHISNIHARDKLHRHSILSGVAKAVICGLGPYGYIVALQSAAMLVGTLPKELPSAIRVGPH
jgi:3-dehydroquinate dehydratase II